MDPVFALLADAVYDGARDPRELWAIAKSSPTGTDPSTPSALTKPKKPATERKLAATGLVASGVAGIGGLHALYMASKEVPKAKKAGRLALAGALGWTGLHSLELAGDTLGARAQVKAYKQNEPGATPPPTPKQVKPVKKQARSPFVPVSKAFDPFGVKRTAEAVNALHLHEHLAAQAADVAAPLKRVRGEKADAFKARQAAHAKDMSHVDRAVKIGQAKEAVGQLADRLKPYESTIRAGVAAATAPKPAEAKGIAGLVRQHPVGTATTAGLTGALGANEVSRRRRPMMKSYEWRGEISKVDEDKQLVFGWFSLSKIDGKDVVDLQGDHVPIEETEEAAYKYVLTSRKGGDMHERVAKFSGTEPRHTADLVESIVFTDDKIAKMGLPDNFPRGWWGGFKVNDPQQWAEVKAGRRTGFSIHGSGIRKEYVPA